MASSRGFLNIQSLNELTYENVLFFSHSNRSLTAFMLVHSSIETVGLGGLRFVRTSRGGEERRSVPRIWGDCTCSHVTRCGTPVPGTLEWN